MTDDTKLALPTPAPLAASEAQQTMSAILRMASDPTLSVDKLERLLAMQERMQADLKLTSYRAALSRLQAALPQIAKTDKVVINGALRSKYAALENIDQAIRPFCAAEGFAFAFDSHPVGNAIEYSCTMSHRDGHAETKTLTLPADTGPGRNAVQAVGSTTTYARRYLLEMHLHLVKRDEDDDGNGGSRCVTPEQAAEIAGALTAAGGNAERFLRWLQVPDFGHVLEKDVGRAMRFIGEKKGAGK